MFSSPSSVIGLILSLVLFVSGCGKVWNEDNQSSSSKQNLQLKSEETSCFSKTNLWLQKYFSAKASEDEVNQFWQCLGSSIQIFYDYVEGHQKNTYGSQELIHLLEKYVVKESISRKSFSYVMEIKALILGGKSTSLTRQELEFFLGNFNEFVDLSLRLRPYMDIFFFKEKWQTYGEDQRLRLHEGIETFLSVQKHLGNLIAKNKVNYDLSHFPHFLESLQLLVNPKIKWSFVSQIKTHLPLLFSSKELVVGKPRGEILANQWPAFIDFLSVSFTQYLRMEAIGQQGTGVWSSSAWPEFRQSLVEISQFLVNVHKRRGKKGISLESLEKVFKELHVLWPSLAPLDYDLAPIIGVKKLLLGGKEEILLTDEIRQIPYWASIFYKIQKKLKPYLDVYTLKWTPQRIGEKERLFFERSLLVLGSVTKTIQIHLKEAKGSYRIESLISLIELIEHQNHKEKNLASFLKKLYPALLKYKKIFIGGDPDLILINEWKSLVGLSQSLWGEYIRYYYYRHYKNREFVHYFWNEGVDSVENLVGILRTTLNRQGISEISVNDLASLMGMIVNVTQGEAVDLKEIRETIALKKLFLGGEGENIRVEELDSLLTLNKYLKHYSRRMKKFENYIFPEKVLSRDIPEKEWEEFVYDTRLLVRDISFFMKSKNVLISVDKLSYMIKRWFFRTTDPLMESLLHKDYIQNFKGIVTGDYSSNINSIQWPQFLKNSTDIYLAFLSEVRKYRKIMVKEGFIGLIKHPKSLDSMLKRLSSILKKQKKSLKTEEIVIFLRPFFKGVSREKLKNWLVSIKTVVVGGEKNRWTAVEIFGAAQKFQNWVDAGNLMGKYPSVWSLKNNLPKDEFTKFEKDLDKAVTIIGRELSQHKQRIEMIEVSSFIKTLEEVLDISFPKMLKDNRILKRWGKLLIGKEKFWVQPDEWQQLLKSSFQVFTEFARWEIYKNQPEKAFIFNSMDYRQLFQAIAKICDLNGRGYFKWSEILQVMKDLVHYYPEFNIFPFEWSDEIPRLKTVFVGGEEEIWRTDDISAVPQVIHEVYQFYLELKPYLPVLALKQQPWPQVIIDAPKILSIFENLGKTFDHFGGVLPMDKFTTMAPQIGKKVFGGVWTKIIEFIDRFYPLITSVKTGLIGGRKNFVSPGESRSFWRRFAAFYLGYWQMKFYLSKEISVSEPGFNYVKDFVELWGPEFKDVLRSKPSKIIVTEELKNIVSSFYAVKLKAGLSEKVLYHTIYHLLQKVGGRGRLSDPIVLNEDVVVHLYGDIQQWISSQGFVNFIYRERKSYSLKEIKETWPALIIDWENKSSKELGISDLSKLFDVLNIDYSLAQNEKGQIIFPNKSSEGHKGIHYSYDDISRLNWQSSLMRAIFAGYSQYKRAPERWALKSDLESIYNDFKELAFEMRFLDPREIFVWRTLAFNADVMTFHSDGDGLISHKESVSLLLMVLSGVSRGNEVYNLMKPDCAQENLDIHEKPILNFRCFSQNFYHHVVEGFNDSPPLMTGLRTLVTRDRRSPTRWRLSQTRLRHPIRDDFDEENNLEEDEDNIDQIISGISFRDWMKTGEFQPIQLSTFMQLMGFIEVLFQRFDINQDGWWDRDEISLLFPLFDIILEEASGLEDESWRRSLLTYIFAYKEVLNSDSWYDKAHFYRWHDWSSQRVRVDRRDVLKSFALLMNSL